MNWDAIGAAGETLGAIGVIITLVYLAYQLRQNTLALKLNAEFAAAQEHVHNSVGVSGTAVPYIVIRGFEDPTQLSPEEAAQFLFWMNGSLRMYQHQHLMFNDGNLSAESWSSTENLLKGFVQTEGFQSYWKSRMDTYSPRFQEFIGGIDTTGIVKSTTEILESIQGRPAARAD